MSEETAMDIGLPEGVRLGRVGDLPAVLVETPSCTAELVLQGAQLVRWRPTGTEPVLFVSEQTTTTPGTPVRGGIPLCGPWFGPGRSGDRTPAHGFYRLASWRLVAAERTDDAVRLTLELRAADVTGLAGAAGWPDDAHLRYEVTLGAELHAALTTCTGADGLDLEEALHTYFVVGDVHQVQVEGFAGAPYVDKLDAGREKQQQGAVTFTGETDRVYATPAPSAIVDPVLGRRVHVRGAGSASAVVWNPWVDKAAAMKDFADDEWTTMLCVETANALGGAVVIPPDSEHTLAVTISVEPLA